LEDVAFKAKSAGIQLEEVLAFFETMKQKGGSIQDATQVLRGILDPTNRKFKGKTLQESLSYASRLSPKRREEIGLTNFRNLNAVNMAMTDTASIQDNLNSLMSRSADIMDQRLNRSTETLARQWEVFKANVADLRLEFMAWAKESGAIDSVKNAFKDAKSYVEGILSVLKDEGWKAALQKIGADIKEAFKIAIDYIKPYAEEIGQRIAEGFMNGIRNIGSGYGNWSRGQAESGQGVIGKTSRFFQKYLYGPAMNFEYGFRGDESIGNVHRRIDQQWNNRHSR
jgi:hypothetical protein